MGKEALKDSELIIGKLYCDMQRIESRCACILRYSGDSAFKFISGENVYMECDNGLIRFPSNSGFYEIPEELSKSIESKAE